MVGYFKRLDSSGSAFASCFGNVISHYRRVLPLVALRRETLSLPMGRRRGTLALSGLVVDEGLEEGAFSVEGDLKSASFQLDIFFRRYEQQLALFRGQRTAGINSNFTVRISDRAAAALEPGY